jgi:hypothetical protein
VSSSLLQFLKGWGANIGKADHDMKGNILGRMQALDARADTTGLYDEGWALRYHLESQLTHLLKIEHKYWRQRGRQSWLLHGDANIAYFHAIANGRRRKCTISMLVPDQGTITETRDLHEYIYGFYRNLMGRKVRALFSPSLMTPGTQIGGSWILRMMTSCFFIRGGDR